MSDRVQLGDPLPKFDKRHIEELSRSGISEATAIENCLQSEWSQSEIQKILRWEKPADRTQCPALVFPFLEHSGHYNSFKRVKPLVPRKEQREDGSFREIKYESPKGVGNRLYIPKAALPALSDPGQPLIITEGEKKSLKATQEGFPCVGLTGVRCFRDKQHEFIPDLEAVAWVGRITFICFDSDRASNSNVTDAESEFAAHLAARGAIPRVCQLSPGPHGEKIGLDDFLVSFGADAFRTVLESASTPAPPRQKSERKRERIGSILRPTDRDNFGRVLADTGDRITLEFVSPEGHRSTKQFPPEELRRADGSPVVKNATLRPGIRPINQLRVSFPALRPAVIEGLLREGETMNIIATPKVGKSWLAYGIALAVSFGTPWLGRFETVQGNVLYIDNELHPEVSAHRIPAVAAECHASRFDGAYFSGEFDTADAMTNPVDANSSLFIDNLRGRLVDIHEMESYFDKIERGRFKLIIMDALYRFLPAGASENDNAAITAVFNAIDRYAEQTGSAFILIHHASKGDQSSKSVTDVGAGAGSQSRAADTHLILRQHEQDDHFAMEAAVRSWPPLSPLVIRWAYPAWSLAEDVDPQALKRPKTQADAKQEQKDREGIRAVVDILRADPATKTQLRTKTGFGRDRVNRLIAALLEDGQIEMEEIERGGKAAELFRLSANSELSDGSPDVRTTPPDHRTG